MNSYWKENPPAPVLEEMKRCWMDGLEDYCEEEIRDAFRKHLEDNPKIRPNVGFILNLMDKARAQKTVVKFEPETKSVQRCSPEKATAILKEAGFR